MKWAIPDEGAWGEKNNYEIFVKGGVDIVSSNLKIPRGMLEFVAGMSGRVIEGIADDTGTRCFSAPSCLLFSSPCCSSCCSSCSYSCLTRS